MKVCADDMTRGNHVGVNPVIRHRKSLSLIQRSFFSKFHCVAKRLGYFLFKFILVQYEHTLSPTAPQSVAAAAHTSHVAGLVMHAPMATMCCVVHRHSQCAELNDVRTVFGDW